METNYTFIDFDGVIVDSEERMLERKFDLGFCNHNSKSEFDAFFKYINFHPEEWNYIIKEAKSINNSVEIIKELENLKKKIAILTKIHALQEVKVKIEVLREKYGILCPIIFVPAGVEKHQVIIPNNQLLIDDSKNNIRKWIESGGRGLIFDSTIDNETEGKVKNLEFLIKQ